MAIYQKESWTIEEITERIKQWINYRRYGNITINFRGGEIPNINEQRSVRPPHKEVNPITEGEENA